MSTHAQLEAAIAQLESQRALLGDAAVDAALGALRLHIAALEPTENAAPPPVAAPAAAPPGASERKFVTILFADISGFTALSETHDPETVRDLMNRCFDYLTPVIERYGGFIDKFIGDEIMALFGAPQAHENDPERALRAALELHTALADFNRASGASLGLHIGVNTGLVITGGIGSSGRQKYSVMGDAVNLAARLTELSEAGETLAGQLTYQLSAALFDFTPRPGLSIRGKREIQSAYCLEGLKATPGAQRGLEALGLQAPLVGRDAEIAAISAALQAVRSGQGGLLVISGEAGVGKSRLTTEVRRRAGLPWYEGRCLSFGDLLSYHPWLDLLRSLLGAGPETPPAELRRLLHGRLDSLPLHQPAQLYPYLADLLGLSLQDDLDDESLHQFQALTGESRRWAIFEAFTRLLEALSAAPLVIVLEDLHWADPTSLDLLDHLAGRLAGRPLLYLALTRPHHGDFHTRRLPALCQRLLTQEISLDPLDEAESRSLIEHLLTIEDLPESVRSLILSRAEGNPLFIEEILRSLISQGLLERRPSADGSLHWGVVASANLDAIEIPTTLQGVIMARLDRLEQDTRLVLQMAAVIGRIFWFRVLDYLASVDGMLAAPVAGQPALDIQSHLSQLEEVELIRQVRHQPNLEYIFKHVLVQEAAYETLLREQRRRFHRRVAEALEQVAGPERRGIENVTGLLAYHYEAAGETEAALRSLRQAADEARLAYSLAEAESYYQRMLRLLAEDDPRRSQALLDLGGMALTRGDFSQAGEHFRAAFALRRAAPADPPRRAQRPLRIALNHKMPDQIDPTQSVDLDLWKVIQEGLAGLVYLDEQMNIIPDLAERWEVDPGGRIYRFMLRPDARWSDGAPITAADFRFTWLRLLDPAQGAPGSLPLAPIQGAQAYYDGLNNDPDSIGVRCPDEHTLEVELAEPVSYFIQLLSTPSFRPLPSHAWPPPDMDLTRMPYSGAFKITHWRDNLIRFERNPVYTGASQGNLESVELHYLSEEQALEGFQRGELDVVHYGAGGPFVTQARQQVDPALWHTYPTLQTFYLGLVQVTPPLDDVRVRKALAMAIDRRARLARPNDPTTFPFAQGGFTPPGLAGHTPSLGLPYDLDEARRLLAEAGYPEGRGLPVLRFFASQPEESPLTLFLRRSWQEIGVEVQITTNINLTRLVPNPRDERPHLVTISWVADYPDAFNFLADRFYHLESMVNTPYMQLVAQARRTLDVQQRMALYHEMDRQLVVEQVRLVPLFYGVQHLLIQPHVRHYSKSPNLYLVLKDTVMEE